MAPNYVHILMQNILFDLSWLTPKVSTYKFATFQKLFTPAQFLLKPVDRVQSGLKIPTAAWHLAKTQRAN
jgi:hypothetical protein